MGKLRMTVKSTTTPQPTVMPMNLGSNLANRKLPLQTIINNNLWQSRAIKEGKMSVIKTPQGMFIVCPKGGHNVVRRVTPPPVTTVHMQVREHSNYMDEKATWTRVGRYHYFTSQFFWRKLSNFLFIQIIHILGFRYRSRAINSRSRSETALE